MWFRKKEEEITTRKITEVAIGAGTLEFIYVMLITWFIFGAQDTFFRTGAPEGFYFVLMLIMLVISASISGVLVLGYPAYLIYLKKIREGIFTLIVTLITLLVYFILGLILIWMMYPLG